jgi:hypothetical protein
MASADERLVGAAAAMASAIPSDLGVNRFLLRLFAQKKSMSEKDSDPNPGAPSRSPRSRSRSTTVEGVGVPFRKNAKPVKNCRYPVADHAPPRSEILIAPTIPHPIRSYRSLAMLTDETRAPPE